MVIGIKVIKKAEDAIGDTPVQTSQPINTSDCKDT